MLKKNRDVQITRRSSVRDRDESLDDSGFPRAVPGRVESCSRLKRLEVCFGNVLYLVLFLNLQDQLFLRPVIFILISILKQQKSHICIYFSGEIGGVRSCNVTI